jgi:hypothetical protein
MGPHRFLGTSQNASAMSDRRPRYALEIAVPSATPPTFLTSRRLEIPRAPESASRSGTLKPLLRTTPPLYLDKLKFSVGLEGRRGTRVGSAPLIGSGGLGTLREPGVHRRM